MNNSRDRYRALCETEQTIPVFSQPWWLDSVCGENKWDVVIVEKGGEIQATMPYYMRRRGVITMPLLTQAMGPWLRSGPSSYAKELSRQKELMTALIRNLPDYHLFYQHFHYAITNWLPFYWQGFSQTTRYTYVIDDLSNLDQVFAAFSKAKRKNLKKAQGEGLEMRWDVPCDVFYNNHAETLAKQGETISYGYDLFKEIYNKAYERNQGRTLGAFDSSGRMHSAIFLVWDSMSAYDLISTIDPDLRNSGSATLLIQDLVKFVAEMGLSRFDFEGSMIESVENSFRQFGAKQYSYFSITRDLRSFGRKRGDRLRVMAGRGLRRLGFLR